MKEVTGATLSDGSWTFIRIPRRRVKCASGSHASTGYAVPPWRRTMVRVLELLDCRIAARDGEGVTVAVPGYRVDVHREADLVEEVLRIHGYDRIPLPEQLMLPAVVRPELSAEGFQEQVALHLAARGFREVMTLRW